MSETAKERIVRVAIALFAERGYAGTSVADIQAAAGLAPGSGAMYKHFRSKQEVLAAAIDQHIRDFTAADSALELPGDPAAALKIILTRLLEALQANASLVRISLRDPDARPELAHRMADASLPALHRSMRACLRSHGATGKRRPH